MVRDRTVSHFRRRALRGLQEKARIKQGNDVVVRVCMIGLAIAIVAITPVTWGWKIALFSVIMLVVGIIMPVIWRAKRNAD
jgi:Flp pilus assembly protein TadB